MDENLNIDANFADQAYLIFDGARFENEIRAFDDYIYAPIKIRLNVS